MLKQLSDLVEGALYRKKAGILASQASFWGSINLIICGIIIYDLNVGGLSSINNIIWWILCVICIGCILNIVIHLKAYIGVKFSMKSLEVTDKQRKLLSVSNTDVGFKSPSSKVKSSEPAAQCRTPKLSELYEASLRTPPPQQLPATPMNTSNNSWLSTGQMHSTRYSMMQTPCASQMQNTPMNMSSQSWMSMIRTPPAHQLPATPLNNTNNHSWMSMIRTPPAHQLPATPLNNTKNHSWMTNSPQDQYNSMASSNNSFNNSSFLNTSGSPSMPANSWIFHRSQSSLVDSYNIINSPRRDVFNDSLLDRNASPILSSRKVDLPLTSSPHPISSRRSISSKQELDKYLLEFQERERKKQILSQSENGNGGNNSLWAYNSPSDHDILNNLKHNVYQVATKDEGQNSNSSSNKNENFKTNIPSSSMSKIWLKRNVTPKALFQYEENLRIWLSSNILQPLVKLIDSTNKTIATTAPELQIGTVGVDKLRKAAQNMSGVKQLNNILPFIDMSIHQDYLVQRLRDLSKGGAISAFKWNSGGNFNGKPWRDEYQTDSYILLHLFAMYMDNHLPPDPTIPDGRVFSNVHIVKTPEKPPKPAQHPHLYLSQVNPPHVNVILPGEEECEVGGGHKNFLHALLLFCHYIVHQQHSHIAGVNLKLSGINLAWVLQSE